MAKKIDDELLDDARQENRQYVKKNGTENGGGQASTQNPAANTSTQNAGTDTKTQDQSEGKNTSDEKKGEGSQQQTQGDQSQQSQQNQGEQTAGPQNNAQSPDDEFKQKFQEYFKGNPLIAGEAIVSMVDDLKGNLFMIHAKKKGVDLPKEAFLLDPKSKELASFLIDYAVKNKLFDLIKKYPIVAATGVMGISAVSTYLFIELMAGKNQENENMKKKIAELEEKLKKKRRDENRANATDVEEETEEEEEEEETETTATGEKKASTGEMREFIKNT